MVKGRIIRVEPNAYSDHWFKVFPTEIAEARTTREIDFVCACAPLPSFRRVIDVDCGMGRHARGLFKRGYLVTGVERDAVVVSKARELAGGPSYLQADIRDYQPDSSTYDVVIIMAQSFGYFDASTNRHVLQQLAVAVREGGRIVLDLWNPEFFISRQGERDLELPDGIVRERKRVENGRLFVHLDYPDDGYDDFEWELFTPAQMISLTDSTGLNLIISCTDFDMAFEPNCRNPRIQFVLERRYA